MAVARTSRNRATRLAVGKALIGLMEKNRLPEISVSMIVREAGVSRMTFYHYYNTKEEVLTDYLWEIIIDYMDRVKRSGQNLGLRTHQHLAGALEYFSRHAKFMLMMERNGYYGILIEGVDKFLVENFSSAFDGSRYNLCFYAGGLLNVFLQWLKSGKKESRAELADIILSYR